MASTTAPGTITSQALIGQPAFAPQLRYPAIKPLGQAPDLQKGYMIWDTANGGYLNYTGGAGGTGRAVFNYLFNPSEIIANFAIGDTTAQILQQYPYQGASNINAMPMNQTATWTVYFDRTYELRGGPSSTTTLNDPGVIGVQADVLQLMQFTGMLSQVSIGETTAIASTIPQGQALSPMAQVMSWAYFGEQVGSGANALQSQLAYYGTVSSFTVDYTAFNQSMVPRQCSIQINFTMYSPYQSTALSTSAANQGVLNRQFGLGNYSANATISNP